MRFELIFLLVGIESPWDANGQSRDFLGYPIVVLGMIGCQRDSPGLDVKEEGVARALVISLDEILAKSQEFLQTDVQPAGRFLFRERNDS